MSSANPTPVAPAPVMRVTLTVEDGPHRGDTFACEGHDTATVGRSDEARWCLPNDPYLGRNHFLLEVNPPACRVLNLSKYGTLVNGRKVASADLCDGDRVRAGGSTFLVGVERPPDDDPTPQPSYDSGNTRECPPLPSTAPPAFAPLVPGYEIRGELGRGGMGVVYRAARTADGAAVALKTILPGARPNRTAVDRFLREAAILRTLDHPHVVAFHDMGDHDGTLWFAMDLVDGTDAATLVKGSGPLPVPEAVRLAGELLAALGYAHARGFVHRDVKPANVLLAKSPAGWSVRVADFGLARTYQASRMSGLTVSGTTGGTPLYMAPEQVRNFRDVKPPADQYAAAATLYFLLTGQGVYDRDGSVMDLYLKILQQPPVPLADRRPDLPAALGAVVMRGLARDPAGRWPDVRAFAAALAPFAG